MKIYKLRQLIRESISEVINEGRYDKSANVFSRIVFEKFKEIHDSGRSNDEFQLSVGPYDEDIKSNQFEFDLIGAVEITEDEYLVDGGATIGYADDGEEITPLL